MTVEQRVRAGDVLAGARLMRDLDDESAEAVKLLQGLYPHTGRAYVIGITGSPGAGKSTLCDMLIGRYRERGHRVGVIAVDPTSPITGGAILGDRIRMQRHAADEAVFIRSVATRGHHGGLSRSTGDITAVLDAMGYDRILIETVGVGQDEVAIVSQAHTVVVVTVPGLGDEIQAIKSGIFEIADILVVNKADREGADRAVHDLESMLALRGTQAQLPPVLKTVASTGAGIKELVEAIEERRATGEALDAKRRRHAHARVLDIVREHMDRQITPLIEDALVDQIVARQLDPYAAAQQVLRRIHENIAGAFAPGRPGR